MCHMCCLLSLCETCQTCVLRVQIWVWNLRFPPVLLLSSCIQGSQLNRLSQGTLPGGVASVLVEIQTVPTVVKTIRGFKKYIEAFWGLTLLYELTWKDTLYVLWQTLTWLESLSFGGSYYFWQWITWEKGREGTQNSPPAYWEPSSSHNIHFAGCIQCKHALRL